ncbi:MAG TPA: PQQ-binding-like beta-propeller repeat protein [Vicinamibacteria bacterium]|nr:PQQ-binding-like beta-propeller repeat protein [Vicinamibacteria bacterium]
MSKLLGFVAVSFLAASASSDPNWPRWRGARMNGVASDANPPVEWSETKNVSWKVRLPGHGSSTPILWGDRLYVLTAVRADGVEPSLPPHARRPGDGTPAADSGQEFRVLALDRSSGRTIWERTASKATPHEGKQENNSYASASALTDGEHLFAYFGSWGLYCYDLAGELLWQKDLGDMSTRNGFGEGASPALHGGTLVVNWDHEGQSFVVALDKSSGKEIWRRNREEVSSWATPLVVEIGGRAQVVTTGTNKVRSYDLATGESIWEGPGLTLNAIPSPLESEGVVYLTSGFRGSVAYAVRLEDARGDIGSSPAILWRRDRDTPYVPSPLLYEGIFYLVKSNSGILTALDAKTGKPHFGPERLDSIAEIYASPVAAAGRVYIVGRDGNALVLASGPKLEVLARNSLDDGFDASPVLSGTEMYLRGYRYLYRIEAE